jgi:hypothetical protein
MNLDNAVESQECGSPSRAGRGTSNHAGKARTVIAKRPLLSSRAAGRSPAQSRDLGARTRTIPTPLCHSRARVRRARGIPERCLRFLNPEKEQASRHGPSGILRAAASRENDRKNTVLCVDCETNPNGLPCPRREAGKPLPSARAGLTSAIGAECQLRNEPKLRMKLISAVPLPVREGERLVERREATSNIRRGSRC